MHSLEIIIRLNKEAQDRFEGKTVKSGDQEGSDKEMSKFVVFMREVYVQGYEVDANDEKEAIEKVRDGDGELLEDHFEYSHTLDSETWTVEKR